MSAEIVELGQQRERKEWLIAIRTRDASIVVEIERRFAEALRDCADLAGVSVDYVERLMRDAWGLPPGGGGVDE